MCRGGVVVPVADQAGAVRPPPAARARRAAEGAVGAGGGGRRSGRRGAAPPGTWRWRARVGSRSRLGLLQGEGLGGPRRWRRGGPASGGAPGRRPPLEVRVGCQKAHAGRPLAGEASLVSGVACNHRQGPGSARRGGVSWRGDPGPVAVGAGGEGRRLVGQPPRRLVGQPVVRERGAVRTRDDERAGVWDQAQTAGSWLGGAAGSGLRRQRSAAVRRQPPQQLGAVGGPAMGPDAADRQHSRLGGRALPGDGSQRRVGHDGVGRAAACHLQTPLP